MRCPKCGYNSFDHLDSCKKCGKDLVEFKQSFGIKSVLFPSQMGVAGAIERDEFDSVAVDAAVSAATGTVAATTAALNIPGAEPMADETDGDDFGFDFMGDSAEDDDLSFDELFEDIPEDEDIEETIEAPKGEAVNSEAEFSDDFSFDLPAEDSELEDSFGFDPMDEISEENAFSFDDDPEETGDFDDTGIKEDPPLPFDLPESSQHVGAPETDLGAFEESSAVFTLLQSVDTEPQEGVAPTARENPEEIYFLEATEFVSPAPDSEEQFEQGSPQDDTVFEHPAYPSISPDNLVNDESPAGIVVRSGDVVTGLPLPRPPLGSCVGAFVIDVVLLAVVGTCFIMVAEAVMFTGQTRLFPSLETLIDLSVPYFLVLFFLAFGYFTLFHFLAGQTPGKMLVGLRVEATNGKPLFFSQAFLRSVGGLFQLIPAGLGYLLVLTSSERRGWNDRLAGTRVVAVRD